MLTNSATLVPAEDRAASPRGAWDRLTASFAARVPPAHVPWIVAAAAVVAGWLGVLTLLCAFVLVRGALL